MTAFAGSAAASAVRPAFNAAATNAAATQAAGLASIVGAQLTSGLVAVGVQIGLSYAFPNVTKVEGPRIGEIPLGFTAEGAPMTVSFGPLNRIAGTVIYISRLKEKKLVEDIDTSGISSGDYQELTTYKYSVDLAVAVGEGEISNVTKIWADGDVIFRRLDARPSQTATILSVEKLTLFNGFLPILLRLKSSDSTIIDLTEWTTPSLIDISGFANAGNNLTAGIVRRAFVDPDDPTVTFLDIFSLLVGLTVTEAEGATVTIVQSFAQVPGFNLFRPKTATSITVRKGDNLQTQDANLEANRLIETIFLNTPLPAFRHTAYVTFNNLNLEPFNNRVPRLEFLVEKATTQTLGDTINILLQRGGIPSRNIDVSDIQDTNIQGYTIYGPVAMINSIQTLVQAFNLIVFEVDGRITFKHRENSTVIPLNATELAAHETDSDAPRTLDITDIASFNLPKTVNVNYFDNGNDFQKANQQERRVNATVDTTQTIDFPITMTASQASQAASRFLWSAWTNRQSVDFTLPPSRLQLNELETVTVTVDGNKFRIIVTQINRGNNFKLECQGFIESIEALNFTKTVDAQPDIGDSVDSTPFGDSLIALGFIDIAPFANAHVNTSGAYFALADYDRLGGWSGAQLFIGTTDVTDSGLSLALDAPNESIMGYATTLLADGDTETTDIVNTVDVELFNGTLTSKTELQVFEGQNIALLGDEVIGFQTAILNANGSYTLSNLLRGLRGTQIKTTTHALNDRFIPLITGNLAFYGISSAQLNEDFGMKAISTKGDLADVPLHTHTYVGGTVTPFAPTQVEGTRDGSDNVTTTWERVTTTRWNQFGSQPFPANEFGDELYTIEYRNSGDVLQATKIDIAGPARTDTFNHVGLLKIKVFHQGTLVTRGPGTQISVS